MRHYLLATTLAASALALSPAVAVTIPGEPGKMTDLPADWLDDELTEPRDVQIAEGAADADDLRGGNRADKVRDRRENCGASSGTTGAILGAIAGGLLGSVIDGGDHRTVGTIVGAGGGALLGRKVEQDRDRCR